MSTEPLSKSLRKWAEVAEGCGNEERAGLMHHFSDRAFALEARLATLEAAEAKRAPGAVGQVLIPIDELREEQARAWVEGPLSQHLGDRCYILAERDDAGFWQARIPRPKGQGWLIAQGHNPVDAMRNAVRQATVPFGQARATLCVSLPAPCTATPWPKEAPVLHDYCTCGLLEYHEHTPEDVEWWGPSGWFRKWPTDPAPDFCCVCGTKVGPGNMAYPSPLYEPNVKEAPGE
jgi:hypothetical protein